MENIGTNLKKGDWVYGPLIPTSARGKVIDIGEYEKLSKFDTSGAMKESIKYGGCSTYNCVAVKFPDGHTAVYPKQEVYRVTNMSPVVQGRRMDKRGN